jgi:hypothetical protein
MIASPEGTGFPTQKSGRKERAPAAATLRWRFEATLDRRSSSNCRKGGIMKLRNVAITACTIIALGVLLAAAPPPARTQDGKTDYPKMAPLEQYLMADRDGEIALARSAAPESISGDADVLVLTRRGYETAVKGKNGFVCLVERSWDQGKEDSDFWNPQVRSPFCLNAAAARFYLPRTNKRTELALGGRSKAQVLDALTAGVASKELVRPEPGAVCYMMSKQGYLNHRDGHWHPHLMFYASNTEPTTWGANLQGSPVLAIEQPEERLITFLVPVRMWSDGTADLPAGAH